MPTRGRMQVAVNNLQFMVVEIQRFYFRTQRAKIGQGACFWHTLQGVSQEANSLDRTIASFESACRLPGVAIPPRSFLTIALPRRAPHRRCYGMVVIFRLPRLPRGACRLEDGINDLPGLVLNPPEMVLPMEALRVYFIYVFRSGWSRRKPAIGCHHLEPPDGGAVAWSPGEFFR